MSHPHHDCPSRFRPTPAEVGALIARARADERGIAFLRNGAQDAVAAVFGVHAFTVDAARRRLEEEGAAVAGTVAEKPPDAPRGPESDLTP